MDYKILPLEQLINLRENHPKQTIVHCHGVFDLLHYGHLQYLRSAKKMGDILVVTITADNFVNKGPNRPVFDENKRADMISALDIVDFVAISYFPTAVSAIEIIKPDFYVKGSDYKNKKNDITGGILIEEETVKKHDGSLVFVDDELHSSTTLINNFFHQWSDDQLKTIEQIRSHFSFSDIEEILLNFKNLKVLVLGEPIIDTYRFCKPLHISSKSPSISAEFIEECNYTGGSLAIAKHLDALGSEVSILVAHGNELLTQQLLTDIEENTTISCHYCPLDVATPRKTRYIEPFKSQRIFEITNINNATWIEQDMTDYINKQNDLITQADLVILADFGHGLYENIVLESLQKTDTYLALNVQTNSSNYGFNIFSKHKNSDYLCIDEKELRLGMHNRYSAIKKLAQKGFLEHQMNNLTITLGSNGSLSLREKEEALFSPCFFNNTVDTTGAGDAYFAITSLLNYLKTDLCLSAFLGNLFAGLKAQIIGNKTAVSRIDLIRTAKSILTK